jgi:type 1 fimbria pilin
MSKQVRFAMVLLAGLLTGSAQAVDGEAEMSFHGTLMTPPLCTINDGEQIDVDFGERVGINKVDGVNYRVPVNYQISCEQNGQGWTMSLSLNGTATGFDGEALQTDKSDLGVRVYRNDVPFTPNSAIDINPASPLVLTAVPVKRAGATLTEGKFEALVTLQVDYK